MRVIRRYARAIAEEFHPTRSSCSARFAYGTPHPDSDVDLLVVMPTADQHNQAVRILYRLAAPFPLDLIVRTPKEIKWRLEERESFLSTIVSQGEVLYEKDDKGMGQEGRTGGPFQCLRQQVPADCRDPLQPSASLRPAAAPSR